MSAGVGGRGGVGGLGGMDSGMGGGDENVMSMENDDDAENGMRTHS